MDKAIPDLIDRGYELKRQIKALEEESSEIKKVLRIEAANQEGADRASGETVVLQGRRHKAKINLSEDSFSVAEDVSTTEIRRMKAIIGCEAMTIQDDVKIKSGLSLRQVKERLGEVFYDLFEEDVQTKFDAQKMTMWIRERGRTGSQGDPMIEFVTNKLQTKPNTARVTFSK
jgi:hypothetical protein